jgi:hypothetical protein
VPSGVPRRRRRNLGGSAGQRGSGKQVTNVARRLRQANHLLRPLEHARGDSEAFRRPPSAPRKTVLSPSFLARELEKASSANLRIRIVAAPPTGAGSGRRSRREGRAETSPEGTWPSGLSRLQLVGGLAEREHEGGVRLPELLPGGFRRCMGRRAPAISWFDSDGHGDLAAESPRLPEARSPSPPGRPGLRASVDGGG